MKSSIKNYGLKILKILVFFFGANSNFFLVIKSMKKYLILITT